MLWVDKILEQNAQARQNASQKFSANPQQKTIANFRTMAIVTIPVVVHIVLPNPNLVTNADVQWQIDKLNEDYSGFNPDSTNIPAAFQPLRGHSQIRFVLARRSPSGTLTNGIERITSTTGSNVFAATDPIKSSSSGGADVWDPASYLNFWVGVDGSGLGLLGYAQFPSMGSPADDGIFINFQGWSNNPCYTSSIYNKGRTAVHEVGHYLGLFHIWGDDNGCTGDDFKSLTSVGSSCSLPLNLYNPAGQGNTPADIGDTPNQATETTNCPTGIRTDACSPTTPGKMYQNYMDYTQDACFSLFTNKQVERMEYILNSCRTGLGASLGGIPPAGATTLDASPVQSISPGGIETIGCSSFFYPSSFACDGFFTPKVLIRNNGLTTITSITVGVIINGGLPTLVNLTTTLAFGNTMVVNFPAVNVTAGTYTIQFFTANPNGVQPDQVPANDTITTTLTVTSPAPLPVIEGFETLPFPPTGWSIINPNGDFTWQRVNVGKNSNFSAKIDNYNNDLPGSVDELRTPKLTFSNTDSVIINFDVAHKYYPDPLYYDTLSLRISTDCGATFTTVYKKFGPTLGIDTSSLDYTNPAQGDWRRVRVAVGGNLVASGNIIVAFRNTNRFGNNIFLDNINIAPRDPGDLQLLSIDQPAAINCASPITPQVTVKNAGTQNVVSFSVTYIVDNGSSSTTNFTGLNIPANQQMSFTLTPDFSVALGPHNIQVYISNVTTASGAPDPNQTNDTLRKVFSLVGTSPVQLSEGFESTTFPPMKWAIDNPDQAITWERTTTAAKTGSASMVIRNFDYPAGSTTDKFVSPVIINSTVLDSLFVSFDLAYNPGAIINNTDTLEILVTTDCGLTFSSVLKKSGSQLQTSVSASGGRFIPTVADWKNIKNSITEYVGKQNFQVYFVASGNHQNNIYIDNIQIFGITLPAPLKLKGYDIYPNPFSSSFVIQSLLPPVNLLSVQIFNVHGQKVWEQILDGKGSQLIPVDLGNLSSGVYIVKLNYTFQTIVERVVKR